MFKYVWILILVGLYVLFGYSTIKDIINTLKQHEYDDILDFFDDLESPSIAFIVLTVLVLACSSFGYWIICAAGG
jgi:uncharacterized membrane protein